MGFVMELNKQDNVLYIPFPNAYWSIDNIIFTTAGGEAYCEFSLNAWGSREAKHKELYPLEELSFGVGGPTGLAYAPKLYEWLATFPTLSLFPDDIPVAESEQREVLYAFVKDYLQLENYLDVFEDGQNG